jgi:hypothetical protein
MKKKVSVGLLLDGNAVVNGEGALVSLDEM